MVGGAIVLAVAIELTIAHPSAPLSTADAAVMLAGPTIFLAGNALFLHSVTGSAARIPLGGIAAIALLGPVALADNRLALGGAATIVLLILAGLVLRAPQQRHRRASI
jgi:low temperature requirement protein LtrA